MYACMHVHMCVYIQVPLFMYIHFRVNVHTDLHRVSECKALKQEPITPTGMKFQPRARSFRANENSAKSPSQRALTDRQTDRLTVTSEHVRCNQMRVTNRSWPTWQSRMQAGVADTESLCNYDFRLATGCLVVCGRAGGTERYLGVCAHVCTYVRVPFDVHTWR